VIQPDVGSGLLTATAGPVANFSGSAMSIDADENSSFTSLDGTYSLFAVSEAQRSGNTIALQFSTLSAFDLTLSADMMGDSSRVWVLDYSLDGGSSYTSISSQLVLQAPGPAGLWGHRVLDLSGIDALENQSSVILRLNQGISQNGYVVRFDNIAISAAQVDAVPEPTSFALFGVGGLAMVLGVGRPRRRRRNNVAA